MGALIAGLTPALGAESPPSGQEAADLRARAGTLAGREPVAPGVTLEVVTAELVDGEVAPTEHGEVRWLTAARLGEVDWLEPDRPFLTGLVALLVGPRP